MCTEWDRRSDHDPITNINADVRHAGGVIRPDKEDEITGLCIRL